MHLPGWSAPARTLRSSINQRTRRTLLAACAAAGALGMFMHSPAWGDALSWDGDGFAPVNGGFGLWDNVSPRWSGGSGFVAWNDANNDDALFGSDPGSVLLSSNRSTNSLTFASDYTLLNPATGPLNIDLGAGSMIDTGPAKVEIQNSLSGTAGLTKSGSGLLIFHGSNSGLSGPWNINAGIIAPGSPGASIPANTVVNLAAGAMLDLGITSGAYNATVAHLSGDGDVRLQTQSGLGVTTGSMLTITGGTSSFNGVISGSGGRITKTGSATFTINNIQTYTGITQILGGSSSPSAGALVLDTAGGLSDQSGIYFGTGSLNAATLLLNGEKTLGSLSGGGSLSVVNMQSSNLTIGGDNKSTQFNGVLSGTGRLIKTGSGQQSFATNASNWTGGITIQNGMFLAQLDSRLGAAPGAFDPDNIILDGGALGNFAGTSFTLNANRGITVTDNHGAILVPHGTTLTAASSIAGTGRLTKGGPGTLALDVNSSFAGGAQIKDGHLLIRANSGMPLGSGPVLLDGAWLSVIPSFADTTHDFGDLTYGAGAVLRVGRNPAGNSITANFGALAGQTGGTLVLNPVNGINELGAAAAPFIRVTATGVSTNVNGGNPAIDGDVASPFIIATGGSNLIGEFVRYGANGFEKGTYSTETNINSATDTDVFDAVANQAVAATASVFALNVRSGITVSGAASTLNVGAGTHSASVILNGGTISVGTLNFGTRQGVLYAGGSLPTTVGTISSNITGSAGVTKIGEANLRLNSSVSFSGGLTIGAGALTMGASNVLPSSTDLLLTGAGSNSFPRLALAGTQQTVASLASTGGAGTVDLGAGGTLIVSGTGSTQYRGGITGTSGSTLIKEGPGVLTLGETVSTAAVPSTTNSFQRLSIRQGGVVAVSSSSSLPPALNPSMFPVLADTIRLDGGTLRINGRNDNALNSISTFTIASGTAQRGVSLQPGGGIIHVHDALETALLQVDNTTSRNIISGSGNLTKTGAGALRLGPGNTYTGQTILLEGSLQIPADSALGAAPAFLELDQLQIQNAAIIQPLGDVTLDFNRGVRLTGGSGTISNQFAAATIDTTSGSFVPEGGISGPGALKKVGADTTNTLQLTTPNDFLGNFTVEAGRVDFNVSDSAGLSQLVAKPAYPVVLGKQGLDDTILNNELLLEDGSTIEIDVAAGAGSLILNGDISGVNSFSKLGGGTLALNGLGSTFSGNVHILEGTVVAGAEQALGSATGATLVAPGASLAFEGDITHASAEPVYIAGTGVGGSGAIQNLSGANIFGGNVTLSAHATIGVTSGSLKIGNVTGRSTITKIGPGPLTVERFNAGELSVNETIVQIAQKPALNNPADTTRLEALTLAGGSMPTTTLDITNNALFIDYDPAAIGPEAEPFDTIRAQIISAFNGGNWAGPGITSSLLAAGSAYGIGYAEASAGPIPPVFMGADNTSVLIRYTRLGDATLDGLVSLPDFNRLAANFGATGAVWSQGDFNYDGFVNLQDFNRLAANFGLQAGPDGPTPEDWAALASAVPEPVGLGFVAVGGSCALLRRRRR